MSLTVALLFAGLATLCALATLAGIQAALEYRDNRGMTRDTFTDGGRI